ncbi:MAG: BBP7 family outer membrane beta-barrel protein, partial [Pirellulaceae bacterium]
MAWRSQSNTPPLVTTSPNNGVLPQAQVLFGNAPLGGEARPGGRLTIGGWLDKDLSWAIEGRLLLLGRQTVRFNDDSTNTD